MNKRPAIDFELLIPILIGGFSVVGILVVLVIGRLRNSPAEISPTASSTPFQYVYLGTEPAITTLIVDGSELPPTGEVGEVAPTMVELTRPPTTPILLTPPGTNRSATPSRQLTATRTSTPAAANTYDDTDSRLSYVGSWVAQTGLNETGPNPAYQGTLHISSTAGNSVSFPFTGQEIRLYYQSGPSLGTLLITFDGEGLGETLGQSLGGGEWIGLLDRAGSHTVKIEHHSGGSVNIDKIVIPAPTPTPTRTPTP